MTHQEAVSLCRFVNRCSDRYHAETLPLGEQEAWVVLTDTERGASGSSLPPPIADVRLFLGLIIEDDEADSGERRHLLEAWLLDQEEAQDGCPEEQEQVRQDLQGFYARPSRRDGSGDTLYEAG